MQAINTERRRASASARLFQQLPATVIKETTLPHDQKHVNKNLQSSANRVEKSFNQQLQTDLDTQRSLSSVPTYLSLSRLSEHTRECGTQITTLTPTKEFDEEEEQNFIGNPSSPVENNQVLLIEEDPFEEVEFMPVSSGFGNYPYNYPTKRVPQTQIRSRAPQFRDNRNGNNAKNSPKNKPPTVRPTAIKQSPRSDTFLVQNKPNAGDAKTNGTRGVPPPPAPVDKRRAESLRRDPPPRPRPKVLSPSYSDQQDLGRKPVRFANHRTNHPPTSLPSNGSHQPRNFRVADNDYVIQRHRPGEYVYDDYRSNSPIERARPQRYVRMVREPTYEDDDYVEPGPVRRSKAVQRRPPSTEYVYVDETPPVHRRARRPEVVYVDDDRAVEYEDEYIYVDEDGNEVEFAKNRPRRSPEYVEYIYEDDYDRKRSHKPKVIYVNDDRQRKSKKPSSTRIRYE